ncbi:ATP-binding protein [Paenibacillus campi]|uniref:AAA family ATPase n=1 Tax=Paenibacillus campi TaxID=3106031 RepID=UPI002AFE790F|nr:MULTISPECIES: ATP-binding protein [unclassified Paenibacillus]
MLLQFNFENFKSFAQESTLDMMATSIKEHENDVAYNVYNERVLKVAAIFGANASGKSNVFKAFRFFCRFVLSSNRSMVWLNEKYLSPFAFTSEKKPSFFEAIFSTKQNIFQYGFKVDQEQIYEEYLYIRDRKKKKEAYRTLFYRSEQDFELAPEFESIKNLLELLEKKTLFLSLMTSFKIEIVQEIKDWFQKVSFMDYAKGFNNIAITRSRFQTPLMRILKDDAQKEQLEKFIKAVDVGIDTLDVVTFNKIELVDEENIEINSDDDETMYEFFSIHANKDTNETFRLPLREESSGTQKLIALYTSLQNVIEQGGILFSDELDAQLHPLLLRYLINLFHDPKTNPNHAQLIFTTHDVFTLDKDNFRRDEIWFVDKDERGVSKLYSLAEYKLNDQKKVRNDASYGKDYILGKYEAIPDLKPLI